MVLEPQGKRRGKPRFPFAYLKKSYDVRLKG